MHRPVRLEVLLGADGTAALTPHPRVSQPSLITLSLTSFITLVKLKNEILAK